MGALNPKYFNLGNAAAALEAGSVIGQFGSQRQGVSIAQREGDYQAKIYGADAELAKAQAADAIARGAEAAHKQETETRRLVGAQRARLAASGVAVDAGSAVDVQADTAALGKLDELTIRNNAAREAWGFNVQAMDLTNQGRLARAAGRNRAAALRADSWSTLLTGSAKILGDMYERRKG